MKKVKLVITLIFDVEKQTTVLFFFTFDNQMADWGTNDIITYDHKIRVLVTKEGLSIYDKNLLTTPPVIFSCYL